MSNESHRNAVDYLESLTETADAEPVEGWPASLPSRDALMRDIEKKLTLIEGSTSFRWTRTIDANGGITITVRGDKGKLHGFVDSPTDHVVIYEALLLYNINRYFRFEMRLDPAKTYTRHEEQLLCYYPEWRLRQKEAEKFAVLHGEMERRRERAASASKRFEEIIGHANDCPFHKKGWCSCLVQKIEHDDTTAVVEWIIGAHQFGKRMVEAGQN